ncbi:uncharacterized protein RAG0_17298 [Rhynchosporium agropyri]|uniref:Transcription factor domain-containing protein n=1 Tax=Rhynchosporium agropyri TaxID=914238 RepID=A0A1E1LTF4_9HELO|nr:uncharacterized protein RAG0_17298 [Rhynchosporium agropyri]
MNTKTSTLTSIPGISSDSPNLFLGLAPIYFVPSAELFRGASYGYGPNVSRLGIKRKRSAGDTLNDTDSVPDHQVDYEEMIKFFREKLVVFMPALQAKDFEDAEKLFTDELSVIYTKISAPSPRASNLRKHNISFWALKSYVELYAIQHSFLFQGLRTEIISPRKDTPIHETTAWHIYALWLQLFIVSHYASVVTSTPRGVKIDATIRAVPWLIQKMGMHPQFRLLAEVELYLLWETASKIQPEFNEWWYYPSNSSLNAVAESNTEHALQKIEKDLEAWGAKCEQYTEGGLEGSALDYYCRCMRFYFSSCAIRQILRPSREFSDLASTQIRRCLHYANEVLTWYLQRTPVQEESIKYNSEPARSMTYFCCLFVIESCQTFAYSMIGVEETLKNVITTAKMFKEVAPNREKCLYPRLAFGGQGGSTKEHIRVAAKVGHCLGQSAGLPRRRSDLRAATWVPFKLREESPAMCFDRGSILGDFRLLARDFSFCGLLPIRVRCREV